MAIVKIKGHEIDTIPVRNSFGRRALQYKNSIISVLRKIGLTEDDVEIKMENVAIKRVPASVSWYFQGHHLHYSYSSCSKFVENLYVVLKVIEVEIEALINEEKTVEEYIYEFSEDDDVTEQRKKARELLGLPEDTTDLELINKTYKKMAKDAHPDMPNGCVERFKKLNHAHKTLKRELA